MAVVKFIASGCPMNNIFSYVMRDEATERKLVDGVNCMPETAIEEFKFVKARFGKEDGRQYYHIIQSFSPDDDISPEEAHELGMKFAGHFEGFQAVVATHVNKAHLHNHIILNSVNMETGRKYHQSRDEMLAAKRFANDLCREYGLSVTEEKCEYGKMPKWKQQLRSMIVWALSKSPDRETFIEALERHGYGVNWTDGHKYVTFTTPEGYKCRDNKLFDDRCLKCNMDIYFAMGGCASPAADDYLDFQSSRHSGRPRPGKRRLCGYHCGRGDRTGRARTECRGCNGAFDCRCNCCRRTIPGEISRRAGAVPALAVIPEQRAAADDVTVDIDFINILKFLCQTAQKTPIQVRRYLD